MDRHPYRRLTRLFHGIVAGVAAGMFLWGLAHATTVLHRSFPQLVAEAETVAVGTVTAIGTEPGSGDTPPFTLVTFADLEVVKGEAHGALTVRILGGPGQDGTRLTLMGTPTFTLGERVIVFVAGNETHAVPFVGLWQGVYRVLTDPETGEEVVATHTGQPVRTLPEKTANPIVTFGHEPRPHTQRSTLPPFTLDEFVNAITREVRREHTQ